MASDDTLGASTLQPGGLAATGPVVEPTVLTIAAHPDPTRVGQWAPLGVSPVSLSRLSPLFGPAPLRDRHLSRNAIAVSLGEGGSATVVADGRATPLRIDGRPSQGTQRFTAADLARGVVLTLAEQVVLVMHHGAPATDGEDDLGLVGPSASLAQARDQIRRVSAHDVPVLVRGASGTGKELVAQAIHRQSPRSDGPFVSVNMAALVASTAAASLFGHDKGAFTGAVTKSGGFFGEADGGTIFLDEIGELPGEIQPALLRALDSHEVQPLGASRTVKRDVRVVAATDAALERMVDDGAFRLPLLQRLAGYEIALMPLRRRRIDIAVLLHHFLREQGALVEGWLPTAFVERALLSSWSGNVRQLRNVVQRLVIDWSDKPRVEPTDAVLGSLEPPLAAADPKPARSGDALTLKGRSEDEVIAVLRAQDYKLGPTAKELGVSRTSLYALIDASSRIRKAGELSADEVRRALEAEDGDVDGAARELEVSARGLRLRMKQLGLD